MPAASEESPEEAFDRVWVDGLIERATERVREQCAAAGQEIRFRVFEEYEMAPPGERPTYRSVAEKLGLGQNAVRHTLVAIHEQIRVELRAERKEPLADFGQALEGVLEGWQDGSFFPRLQRADKDVEPDACRYCDFSSAWITIAPCGFSP